MNAADVMTGQVISIAPDASILEMTRLMLQHKISGLPVIDRAGNLVGIVTEGDFLRRTEIGTERKRPHWLEFLTGRSRLADEYIHSHARKVEEVMTPIPVTISEDTPLDEVVHLMERYRVKRLPVVRGREVIGIVSRANLLHALASLARTDPAAAPDDAAIRNQVTAEMSKQPWAPRKLIDVTVRDGIVELWGVVFAAHQREAAVVVAENVPGVKAVRSHLAWVDPTSGMVISEPDERPKESKFAPK